MPDDLSYTVREIEELAKAAHSTWWWMVVPDWDAQPEAVRTQWREVVRAVLRKRQEQAMRRLYRDVIEVKEHSHSALAWIEDGQVKCCSSLCRREETCDQCETHGCRPVLVYEEEALCRA